VIRKRDKTYQRHAKDKSSEDEVKSQESLASFPAKCQGCLKADDHAFIGSSKLKARRLLACEAVSSPAAWKY
jgi:hypothetical protein